MSPAFQAFNIVKQTWEAFTGFVTCETEEELTLQHVGGVKSNHRKSEIQNRTTIPPSLMPAGLQQLMTFDNIVDLVEYLAGLKSR